MGGVGRKRKEGGKEGREGARKEGRDGVLVRKGELKRGRKKEQKRKEERHRYASGQSAEWLQALRPVGIQALQGEVRAQSTETLIHSVTPDTHVKVGTSSLKAPGERWTPRGVSPYAREPSSSVSRSAPHGKMSRQ
ncbi:hypothetical protein EYF80_024333 [Liparis tanakae]|uniref:Uncharacterized protein n=1 Tax=Liparis tanakae TaxID=230148 RepID=A0A4Z2HKQ6_9TELE|nr:hypothetical protein EYF80_024333 [Liparis tanakae]